MSSATASPPFSGARRKVEEEYENERFPDEVKEVAPLESPEPPPIPLNELSGWHRDQAVAISEATETPPELSFGMTVAAVAMTSQGKFDVLVEPGYYEPLPIYAAPIYPPGGRKTAVVSASMKPLIDFERRLVSESEADRSRLATEHTIKSGMIKSLHTEAMKAKTEAELKSCTDRILKLQSELPEVPPEPCLLGSDITPEHLGTLLAQHNERLGIYSDEAGILGTLLGTRYSPSGDSNMDLVLQAYSCSPVSVDRGSRPRVRLRHPCLSIAVTPQSSVVTELLARRENRTRGLAARFFFLAPRSRLGERDLIPRAVPDKVARTYADQMTALLEIPLTSDRKPRALTLEPNAYRIWKSWQREVEDMMRPGGKLHALTDVGGKFPGQTARIAGIIHLTKYPAVAENVRTIEASTMQSAVAIARVLLEHNISVLSTGGYDHDLDVARKLWNVIRDWDKFKARNAWMPIRGTVPKMIDAAGGFRVLEERGYITELDKEQRGGRPSKQYRVTKAAKEFCAFAH